MVSLFGVTMLDGDWKVYKFCCPNAAAVWLQLQTTPASYIVSKQTAEEIAGTRAVKKAVEWPRS